MNKEYSFKTIVNKNCIDGKVIYYKDDGLVFKTNHGIDGRPFSLMIGKGYNAFDFSDKTNRASYFGGHNPKQLWKDKELIFPQSQKGEIYIENELEHIMDGQWYVEDWNTYYDERQKIICIGDYNTNETDIAIEFCTNIVAVFQEKYLKAIWVRDIEVEFDINN